MQFGVGQSFRFYPEFLVTILPKLFVASSTMKQWKALKKLYGDKYKKGWTVDLEDTEFNALYKAITGYNLETNNYRRNKVVDGAVSEEQRRFGLFEYIEHRLRDLNLAAFRSLWDYAETHGFDSNA